MAKNNSKPHRDYIQGPIQYSFNCIDCNVSLRNQTESQYDKLMTNHGNRGHKCYGGLQLFN